VDQPQITDPGIPEPQGFEIDESFDVNQARICHQGLSQTQSFKFLYFGNVNKALVRHIR
jgi:hypothetical protein